MNTLIDEFNKQTVKALQEKLEIKNPMAVPRMLKIVVNIGVKDALSDKKNVERAATALAQITGQKAKIAKARKSIATFKLREGDPIGVVVTMRGKRMYGFLKKLIDVVLPRIRDFHGVKRTGFDGRGNYSLGLSEYTVFSEIDQAKAEKVQGIEIVIVTSARDNNEGFALLEAMHMPFAHSK